MIVYSFVQKAIPTIFSKPVAKMNTQSIIHLSRLNDEHFFADVVLPANCVSREVNDGTEEDDQVFQQARLAVAEEFDLENISRLDLRIRSLYFLALKMRMSL